MLLHFLNNFNKKKDSNNKIIIKERAVIFTNNINLFFK